jgi:trk system potassium uptake protein
MRQLFRSLSPPQILILGFLTFILIGAILLSLPFASVDNQSIGIVDALFTSTSAVCVTGLVVLDTGTHFTLFGQIVIITLIQCGGLGFMTMASLIFLLVGKRITLKERILLKEALNEFSISSVVRLVRNIILVTISIELVGAIFFAFRFIPELGFIKGVYFSIFHSISAFCNAGFDLMGGFNSFIAYVDDPLANIVMIILITLGGLGFVVMTDIVRKFKAWKTYRLKLHTKIVLVASAILILVGLALYFPLELNNPKTLGNLSTKGKVLGGIFQSVTPRTAGFSTIDQNSLTLGSKFLTMILMYIGASPAGTGGGVKTTTAFVIMLLVSSVIKGQDDITFMKRRIDKGTVLRAVTLFFGGFFLVITVTLLLLIIEGGTSEVMIFENILFEAFSAFGTVGLGTGVTPLLQPISRIILTVAMFAGRVGLMTVMYALANRMNKYQTRIRYTQENVMIG